MEQLGITEQSQESDAAIRLAVDNTKEKKVPPLQKSLDALSARLERHADEHSFKLGYAEGTFYCYQNGHWRVVNAADRQELNYILKQICTEVGLVYADSQALVWRHLESDPVFALDRDKLDAEPWVAVQNGTIYVPDGDLYPHDCGHYTTRYIDVKYDKKSATCPAWLKILNNIFKDRDPAAREAIISTLQEWFGMAVAGGSTARTPRALRKALFLYGPPRTGKSTITDVLQTLLGMSKVVVSAPIDVTQRFGLEAFLSASGWICEEVQGLEKKLDTARIKALITGERLSVQRKGVSDATLRFNGPIIWAGNSQPNFPESSHAIYDRLMVIALTEQFSKADAKRDFGDKKPLEFLKDAGELPGIFLWALEGYKRALTRGFYVEPKEFEIAGQEWRSTNDPVYAFLSECCEPSEGVFNAATSVAWAAWSYIRKTRNEYPSLQKLRRDLRSAIPERYPSVRIDGREFLDGKRVYTYGGLALNKQGLAWLEEAKKESDAADSELTGGTNHKVLGQLTPGSDGREQLINLGLHRV